jgi:uncharacterized protein
MFPALPIDKFVRFHSEFRVDTWDVCSRCGGKCELNKIGSLMPGEAGFLASELGVSSEHFAAQYLDGVITPTGIVDILKAKPGCPFLGAELRCSIAEIKVVLCETYPIVFEVNNGRVEFSLDPWCPIVRHVPELAEVFEQKGIPALRRLEVPLDWYRSVASYDALCVDYGKLYAVRASDPGYVSFTLEQIEANQDDDAPPPEF